MTKILAASTWKSNAHLIADAVVPMRYLRPTDVILDPTFGKGVWWKRWTPTLGVMTLGPLGMRATTIGGGLVVRTMPGEDFRNLEYEDASFDAIAFDPPYTCVGGRDTSGIKEMYGRYGMLDAPKTPAEVQHLMDDGLAEMFRLVRPSTRQKMHPEKPNGIVLMKCKNYVWSGSLWLGVHWTIEAALGIGFVVEEIFEHVALAAGPQPARTRKDGVPSKQEHAAHNLSTLLVLRRPKAA